MTKRFNDIIQRTLQLEGGYQRHSGDSGNYVDGLLIGTNYGISAPTLKAYLGRTPTESEMRNLTREEAIKIYHERFWKPAFYDRYKNVSIAEMVFDAHVNHGSTASRQMLNASYNKLKGYVFSEPVWSREGVAKLNTLPEKEFFDTYYDLRLARYKSGNPQFLQGWINRLDSIKFEPTKTSPIANVTTTVREVVIPNKNYPSSYIVFVGITILFLAIFLKIKYKK